MNLSVFGHGCIFGIASFTYPLDRKLFPWSVTNL